MGQQNSGQVDEKELTEAMSNYISETSSNAKPKGAYNAIWHNVPEKIRKYEDGGRHSGKLELVTWETLGDGEDMGPLGWGATLAEESDELREQFEVCSHTFQLSANYLLI